ncbi:MAG: T9SS type A sorting domain-containing protein, partial [Chitinophagaceae bacterium]|nr:T9SS type A sorting domain-containing protein [Chitinophagaceae bacterium]
FIQQNKTINIDPVSMLHQGKYYTSIIGYGCQTVQDSIDIEVQALPSLQVNINTIPEFCVGTGNGSIQVQVNGGSGNYMICKDGGQANCLNGNAVNFNYIQTGSHVVFVTDQLRPDTSWAYAAVVQAGSAPAVPIIPTDISVCQYDTLILSGSTAIGNTIQWKKSGSAYVFNGNIVTIPQASLQDEGIYYAKSIDPNGCASSQIAVNVHIGFKPLIQEVHVNCNTNLLADLIVDADASLGNLAYSLDGITYQSSNTFLNISGGLHHVYVKELLGTCVSMVEVHVPNCACIQSTPIQFDIASLSCSNALIPISAMFNNTVQGHWSSEGSGYFTQVNGNSPLQSSYQPSAADLQKGMVKLILNTDDPDGVGPCEAESNFYLVYLFDTMHSIQITGDTQFCQGDQIKLQSNGIYSSKWSGPSGFLGKGQGFILNHVSPAQSGKYYVELEGHNCPLKKDSIDIQIAVAPNLVISQTTIPEKCAGQGNGQVQFDISGGSGMYQIEYGRPFTSMQGNSPINIKWLSAETYTFYVADKTCPNAKDSLDVILPAGYLVLPPLDAFYNAPVCEGENLILQTTASSTSQFVWTQQGSVFEEIGNPITRLESNRDMSGNYTVSRMENGCLSVPLHLQVKVFEQPEIQQIDTLCEESINGGKIIIHAQVKGDDTLEYALNNGAYQESPVFEGLTNGMYQAHARVKGSDCIATQNGIELYCHCDCNKTNTVGIFPNPNTGSFMLSIQLIEEVDQADVSLIDLSGRIIFKQDLILHGLLAEIPLKIDGLVPGAYWLKVNLGLEKSILPLQIND